MFCGCGTAGNLVASLVAPSTAAESFRAAPLSPCVFSASSFAAASAISASVGVRASVGLPAASLRCS